MPDRTCRTSLADRLRSLLERLLGAPRPAPVPVRADGRPSRRER